MFRDKELERRLDDLSMTVKGLIEERNNPIIGEVYMYSNNVVYTYNFAYSIGGEQSRSWKKFKKCDVSDTCDDKVKIFGAWYDKKNAIYYSDVYSKKKKLIEERIGGVK